uniref:Uncharacterized protein n=1 Tax=Vespula pensylvanica TaxID=30213 RepID=A0A834P5W3_VESPE|nr:hypothetical protein H0235_006066 [Vespula pensylvanica]
MDLFGRVAISWSEVGANGRSRGRGGGGGCGGGGGGGGSGGGEPRTLEEVSTTTGPSAGPKTGPPVQGREEERHPEGEAEVGLAAVSATALKPQGRARARFETHAPRILDKLVRRKIERLEKKKKKKNNVAGSKDRHGEPYFPARVHG